MKIRLVAMTKTTVALFFCVFFSYSFANLSEEGSSCGLMFHMLMACSRESAAPDSCEEQQTSNATSCIERASNISDACDIEIVRKMIDHATNTFKMSDQIICQDHYFYDFSEDDICWDIASAIPHMFSHPLFAVFSDTGCKIRLLTVEKPDFDQCSESLDEFFDKMWEISPCGHIKELDTSKDKISECQMVIKSIHECLSNHSGLLPDCYIEKQPLVKCVEEIDLNPCSDIGLPEIEESVLSTIKRYNANVNSYCTDKRLRQEIIKKNCWQIITKLNIIVRGIWELIVIPEVGNIFGQHNIIGLILPNMQCIPLMDRANGDIPPPTPRAPSSSTLDYLSTLLYFCICFAIVINV